MVPYLDRLTARRTLVSSRIVSLKRRLRTLRLHQQGDDENENPGFRTPDQFQRGRQILNGPVNERSRCWWLARLRRCEGCEENVRYALACRDVDSQALCFIKGLETTSRQAKAYRTYDKRAGPTPSEWPWRGPVFNSRSLDSLPALSFWGALLLAGSLWLGRWRRPLTKLRFPRFKLRSLVSSQNVRNLRHGPRMRHLEFYLDLRTCLCGSSYGCFIERRAKGCGFTLVQGS